MTSSIDVIDHRSPDDPDVRLSVDISAPIDVVFDFIVSPDKVFRWMGLDGEVDPEPGGTYRVRYTDNDVAIGEYVEVVPPTRVSWTWGWEGSDAVPPMSSLVTLTLSEHDGVTTVEVWHSGLPDSHTASEHGAGWSYYVQRLAVLVTGGDPDTVPSPFDGS